MAEALGSRVIPGGGDFCEGNMAAISPSWFAVLVLLKNVVLPIEDRYA